MTFEVGKTALQNKLTLSWSTNSRAASDFIRFYGVLLLFEGSSAQLYKIVSASETTTNNQEVKGSLYRLQNVNNLSKDYIRMCVTCRSLFELFNFISLV